MSKQPTKADLNLKIKNLEKETKDFAEILLENNRLTQSLDFAENQMNSLSENNKVLSAQLKTTKLKINEISTKLGGKNLDTILKKNDILDLLDKKESLAKAILQIEKVIEFRRNLLALNKDE